MIKHFVPPIVLPGGEAVAVLSAGGPRVDHTIKLIAGDQECRTVAASTSRIIAVLPDDLPDNTVDFHIRINGVTSSSAALNVSQKIADGLHMVASPAIDPMDGSIMLMRSGSRGQRLDETLFRYTPGIGVAPLADPVMNPSGFAFSPDGELFVTDRANGDVYAVSRSGRCSIYASGLGTATGIAFDQNGVMHVGDRMGRILRVHSFTESEIFAVLDPSVAAYHLAFGPDGRLYVTAPGLSSHDSVYAVDQNGTVVRFFSGLGRPQGLAFDDRGDLYVAASFRGRKGIVKINKNGSEAELFAAGERIVGLCIGGHGEMFVATHDRVYSVNCGLAPLSM